MYLFDASAIVNLVKRGSLKPLGGGASLDLAVYESLNAVWKEHVLQSRVDAGTARGLVEVLTGVFSVIPLESIRGFELEVYELAYREGLTVYDAAYLYVALREHLTLVSDDRKLLERASRHVRTARTADILKQQ
jgi:Predicted nucleic acid-binding protein, contains PIN domain|uniref:DNA-binding protein n=1 Tax=Thermofilum pendens TaxID=2269 RepID=A0A7C3WTU1_THEPE